MSIFFKLVFFISLLANTTVAAIHSVPSSYSTVGAALIAASAGDTVSISATTVTESFTINKSITLLGVSQATIIRGTVTISANNVTCKDFKVQGIGGNTGISVNGVSNLSLINVLSYDHALYGGSLNNISTLTITGGAYSKNGNHGLSIATCSNIILTNVIADSNSQAGVQLYGVSGTNTVTNITARKNALHGLFIIYGSKNVTVQGGIFSNNGVNQHYDGGGIAIDADHSTTTSNIIINGPITAQDNMTAGIWITTNSIFGADTVKDVVIGQTGVITLSSNNDGGVIAYGNIYRTTITANFTKGTPSAAGILLLGTTVSGSFSPQNTVINNSTFTGYITSNPAISLSSGLGKNSSANVTGTGNTFVGFNDAAAIETIIYHKPDNALLGTVTLTNNNPLPVELVSFTAMVSSSKIFLKWETATEINNYGFEVERKNNVGEGNTVWELVGFVEGHGTSNARHHYSYSDGDLGRGVYSYRLKQIDRDGMFEYSKTIQIEKKYGLTSGSASLEAFPNPFNSMTNFVFEIPETGLASLILYDNGGRIITEIFSGIIQEGIVRSIKFNASAIPSGNYYCVLRHGNLNSVKKVLLIK